MSILTPILELFVGKGNVTEHLVRKLAHFTEYGFLGHLICTYVFRKYDPLQRKVLINAVFVLWTVAFLDETIQIFSHRGPAIVDVWIDLAGGICGIVLVYCAQKLMKK